jgi:hypothetical protein
MVGEVEPLQLFAQIPPQLCTNACATAFLTVPGHRLAEEVRGDLVGFQKSPHVARGGRQVISSFAVT